MQVLSKRSRNETHLFVMLVFLLLYASHACNQTYKRGLDGDKGYAWLMRRVPDAEDVEFEAPNAPKIETPKLSRGWGFGEWVYYKNDFAALPACQNAPHCDICSQFNVLSADVFRQKKLICVFVCMSRTV